MENNLISVLIVPEVSLAILAIACLMYGLFSKNNSFNNATNFAIISLILVSFLVYFDFHLIYYRQLLSILLTLILLIQFSQKL